MGKQLDKAQTSNLITIKWLFYTVNNFTDYKPKILEKRIGERVKSDAPRVSVIIPAFNVAAYIAETLDSALAQTFRDFEIIVINDGSPDTAELEKVLADYFDKIIYLKQENGGAAAARNAAILQARGSLLAFLDGDDVWYPEKLAAQTAFLDANDFEMIYCDALLFGEPLYEGKTFMQGAPSSGKVTAESLLEGRCNILTSGSVVFKQLLMKYGLFDVKAIRVEDFKLWFRLCKNRVKIGYQEKVMVKYRVRQGSLTGNTIEKAKRGITAFEAVRKRNDLTESESRVWQNQFNGTQSGAKFRKRKAKFCRWKFCRSSKKFCRSEFLP